MHIVRVLGLLIVEVIALLMLVQAPQPAKAATQGSGPAKSEPTASSPKAGRAVSNEARSAMQVLLSSEKGRKVWFQTAANDAEAAAFRQEIQAVFEESGWQVAGNSEAGFAIKPGLYLFAADTLPAMHVTTALNGLKAAGYEVSVGSGYREYSDSMKKQNPNWLGFTLAPDQEFLIVVGPQPKP